MGRGEAASSTLVRGSIKHDTGAQLGVSMHSRARTISYTLTHTGWEWGALELKQRAHTNHGSKDLVQSAVTDRDRQRQADRDKQTETDRDRQRQTETVRVCVRALACACARDTLK